MVVLSNHDNKYIAENIGLKYFQYDILHFPNGEFDIKIPKIEDSKKIVIVISISHPKSLLELVFLMKKLAAFDVFLIIPYLFYSRCIEKTDIIINVIKNTGAKKIITFDHHHYNSNDFIMNVNLSKFWKKTCGDNCVAVSPDNGATHRNQNVYELHFCKNRDVINCSISQNLIPIKHSDKLLNSANGNFVIIDDIIDTGKTVISTSNTLKSLMKTSSITVCATHAILSDNAISLINKNSNIDKVYITDSINQTKFMPEKFQILSIAEIIKDQNLTYFLQT